jgi:hypothetical protein
MNMQKKKDQQKRKNAILKKLRRRTIKRPVLFHRIGNRHR